MSEEEKKAIELLKNKNTEYYYRFIDVRDAVSTLLNLIEKLQKEIEEYKEHYENMKWYYDNQKNNLIHKDKIREKIKELEEQEEKLKYDGNRSFADYEQFCKNLKFFKEQIEELLKEN